MLSNFCFSPVNLFISGMAQPRTQCGKGKLFFSPTQLSYSQRLTSNFTRFLFLVMPEYCMLKDICLYYIHVLYVLVCIIHILITHMYHIYTIVKSIANYLSFVLQLGDYTDFKSVKRRCM